MSDSKAYLDALRVNLREQLTEEMRAPQKQPEEDQGFGGDVVDAFQKGAYQGLAGTGELSEQYLGVGEDLRDWAQAGAAAQDETISDVSRESMGKQIFTENEYGGVELGDGAGDYRTWILGLSNVAGQYADLALGGSGFAKVGLKIGGKAIFKSTAKSAAKKGATKIEAERLGKEALEKFAKDNAGGANVAVFTALGGSMAQGQAAIEARDTTMEMSDEELDQSELFSQAFYALYDANPSEDQSIINGYRMQARKHIAEEAAEAVAFDPALLASNTLTELIGGKFLDGVLRGVGTGKRLSNSATGFAKEGATETLQGGMEQYSVNKAIQENVHQDQELMEGVKANALNEGVMGGMVGAGMGAVSPGSPAANIIEEQTPLPSDDINDAQFENMDLGNTLTPALPAPQTNTQANDDAIYAGEGDNWANARIEDQNIVYTPAVDGTQLAGNKNNGLEEQATVVGRAPIREARVDDNNAVDFERQEIPEQEPAGFELAGESDGVDYEVAPQDLSSLVDKLSARVEAEIDQRENTVDFESVPIEQDSKLELMPEQAGIDFVAPETIANNMGDSVSDAIRKERMPEGLDNDARVLRGPFRNEISLAKDQIETLRQSKNIDPTSDSVMVALGKAGGLNQADMVNEGIDAADMTSVNQSGFDSAFTKNGMSLDAAAESLAQHGYLDEGNIKQQLLDKVNDSLRGREHYSNQMDYDAIQAQSRFKAAASNIKTMGYQGFTKAMDKALKGQKLGKREAAAVKSVMDTLSNDRKEYLEKTVRPMRDRVLAVRKMINDGVDLMGSPAYKVELDRRNDLLGQVQDTHAMAEVIAEALDSGVERSIIKKAIEKSNGDMIYAGTLIDEAMAGNLAPLENQTTLDDFFGVSNDTSNYAEENTRTTSGRSKLLPRASQPGDGAKTKSLSSNSEQSGSEAQASDSFLESYSEEDIAQREVDLASANESEEQQTKTSETKAKVDSDVNDFALSGSNQPADIATSQGQDDLLAQPSEPDSTTDKNGPSQAQKAAGNYKKKHVRMHGLEISIENEAGSTRSGTDENGNEWSNTIHYDYGDVKGTTGADGDAIDVFIGKNLTGQKVFVVNQTHDSGEFDEHKVMFGFNSKEAAEAGYLKNYDQGWDYFSDVIETSVDGFKTWLKEGDTKKPFEKLSPNKKVEPKDPLKDDLKPDIGPSAKLDTENNPATKRDFSFKGKVKTWISDIESDLGETITVVESYDDLPANIKGHFDDRIRGAYANGKMYLVADKMLDKAMAVETALHEMLGHHGVMSYLGSELDSTITSIFKSLGKSSFRNLAKRYELDLNTHEGKREAVLEYIAHAAETGKRPSVIQKFIAAIRSALQKRFPNFIGWSDTDVLVLIDRSRVAMKKNKSPKSAQSKMHPGVSQTKGSKQNISSKSDSVKDDAFARLDDAIPTSEHYDDLTDSQERFLNKIGRPTIKQAAIHKIKQIMDNWRLKVRQGLVDRHAALMDLDKKVHGDEVIKDNVTQSSWARARLSGAASGVISAMMDGGRVYFDRAHGVVDVKENSNGLVHTLNKLGSAAEVERFMGWIAANRADKLAQEGRENLFEENEIAGGKDLNQGVLEGGRSREDVYGEVFNEFQTYRDDVLAIAEEAGIITPENRDMWANEFYVPFYRVMEDQDNARGPSATGGLSRQQAIRKLKGGKEELNDLLQNTLMNFHHLIDASLKNIAAQQAVDNAQEAGIAQRVPEATKSDQSTFVLEDGQKVWYDIEDPLVFTAITSLSSTGMNNGAMKVMRAFKRVFTNFTTSSPQFMVANLIRDSLHAVAVTKLSPNMMGNAFGGMKSYLDDYQRARLNATGGAFHFGHVFGEDSDSIKWNIEKQIHGAKLIRNPSDALELITTAWDKWQGMGNVLENSNRASAFKQNESRGKMSAALEARDLMDFSAHGAWPAIRILIDVVPFLNARLQGLDKMWREGVKPNANVIREMLGIKDASVSDKQAAKRFTAVVGSLAMASIALYLHNQDDDEYQKLEDWQKDTYWFFRLGDSALFVPKPFEVGAIATMAERITEQLVDDKANGKLFAERLGHMLGDTFSFNPVPQMFQPALDVYSNKDAFTGRDIESMNMQRLSPNMRVRGNTTSLAKGVSGVLENTAGAMLGNDSSLVLSPVQIDHLIGGYLGWLGSSVSSGADMIAKKAMGQTQSEKYWYEYQPVRRFYRNLGIPGYTKVQTQFYDTLRELDQTYSDIQEYRKLGLKDEANELFKDSRGKLSKRKALNKLQSKLSKLNRRIKLIAASDNSAEWKRRESDKLKVIKNRYMEKISAYVK